MSDSWSFCLLDWVSSFSSSSDSLLWRQTCLLSCEDTSWAWDNDLLLEWIFWDSLNDDWIEDFCKIGVKGRFLVGLCKRDFRGFTEDVEDSGDHFCFSGFSSSKYFNGIFEFLKDSESSILWRRVGLLWDTGAIRFSSWQMSPDASNDPRVLEWVCYDFLVLFLLSLLSFYSCYLCSSYHRYHFTFVIFVRSRLFSIVVIYYR